MILAQLNFSAQVVIKQKSSDVKNVEWLHLNTPVQNVDLSVPTKLKEDTKKMASVIVTMKIMPVSPDVDLAKVEEDSMKEIANFCGETESKKEIEPVAFGLKALKLQKRYQLPLQQLRASL